MILFGKRNAPCSHDLLQDVQPTNMKRRPLRLLAIDLTAKGFGFALLDAKLGLLDWGFSSLPAQDDAAFIARVSNRIDRGRPTALVLENFAPAKSRETATRRCGLAIRLAEQRKIGLCQVSQKIVQGILGPGTKNDIAKVLVDRFPELRRRIPNERKRWTAEDERMHIFDALALAVVLLPQNRVLGVAGSNPAAPIV
jgi:hypothetical protein